MLFSTYKMKNKLAIDVASTATSDVSLSSGTKYRGKQIYSRLEYRPSTSSISSEKLDMNLLFETDNNFFLGTFRTFEYELSRSFLSGETDGVRLYYTRMEPLEEARFQLLIIHGLSEHSGQFLHLGQFFAKNKGLVHLMDLGGSGYSGRKFGGINFEEMQEDIGCLLTQAREDLPLFVLGHSTGTLLALNLAINNPKLRIAGIISASVSLYPQPYLSRSRPFISKIVQKLLRYFSEDVVLLSKINPTAQSKNNFNCIKMIRGQFCNYKITVAMLEALEKLSKFVKEYMFRYFSSFRINIPLLFIHGNLDSIASPQNSISLYSQSFSEDKTIKIFPNGLHMLFHDQEAKEAKFFVLKWMMKRSAFARPFGEFFHFRKNHWKSQNSRLPEAALVPFSLLFHFIFRRIQNVKQLDLVLNSGILLFSGNLLSISCQKNFKEL